jgi:hypothetical protein
VLVFLLRWAEIREKKLPAEAIYEVVQDISESFPDGTVLTQRTAFNDEMTTLARDAAGTWQRKQPITSFALLEQASQKGKPSPFLSLQWRECVQRIDRLMDRMLIV